MKENKGITLVSLVVTIVVLLILATIGTNVGKSVIKDAKYHNTISQMKVMQIKVNELYEKYKDGDVSTVETGEEIPASLIAKATQSFQTAKANNRTEKYIGEDLTGYRYLSSDYIKNSLGVEKSELDYIVNVEYRTVILLDGVKKDGNTYYSLNEIEDEQFNVEYINPTVVLSKNGGTYTIPTNGSISIENILTIVDKPKDTTNITLKLEYAWTTSKETVPTSGWQQAQDGGTIQLDNIRDEGEYYLWTKITNSNLSSITNIENIQTSKPFIVKQASINTYVQYAVVHKQMNLDGTTYTTYETENLRGTEYDTVTPTPKTYTGFTFDEQNSDQNVEINPDGTTSIEYKYTRNRYNLTLGSIEGITLQGSSSPGEYYYGTPINLNATENPGYTFASWQSSDLILLASSNNQQYTFLMPAGNITLTPSISANEYQVAFDSNGGNAVTPSSKSVTYNSIYGELPIPTRVGYTFDGWTGKNLFNIENIVTDAYVNKSGVETQYLTGGARPWSCSDYIEIQGGKTYTFNPNSTNGNGNPSHCIYDENKNFIAAVDSGLQTIVMPQNAKYLRVSFRSTSATAEPSSNIQLEEGSIATEYEPYQIITSSTNVTKTSDHILYAKWAANKYTVKFDGNGATGGSMEEQEFTYDQQQALRKNTFVKDGYIYTGWNGLLYSNNEEKNSTNDMYGSDREFIQYENFAPFFDNYGYGEDVNYELELDLKSENTSNKDIIKVYFQNGSTSRYRFSPYNKDIKVSDTEWTHVKFSFNVNLQNENVQKAMLAFYGTYDTGNKPIVKNVRLSIKPECIDEQIVKNLTSANNGKVTLYANWIKCESTFLPGTQVNGKMKQLAGDSSATYESMDTAISSIVRSNTIQDQYKTDSYIVSTNDSITPIYMWFDNGTIYYYTEDDKPSLNEDSSYLFRGLRSAESIELTDFDTSNVITMQRAFYNCMSLTSLDLSSFNMNKVTSVDNMLYGMTSLIELKTPKVYPTGAAVTISLPKTLYDSSQNSYINLSNGSPIETWLKLEYENVSNINNNQQVTISNISPTQSNSFSGLVSEAKSRKIFIIIAIAVFLSVGVLLRNRRKKQDK